MSLIDILTSKKSQYASDDNDWFYYILDHKKGKNDDWFFEFDKQIKGCRMITPVGVFKKYLMKRRRVSYESKSS